ncbi:MAG: hypothetical protein ACYTG1_13960 [Planctomycetota bacterium]|jgi:hypothetical protein
MDSTPASRPAARDQDVANRKLSCALESLHGASEGCGVYGSGHPAVQAAAGDAADGLRAALADGAVRLGVTDRAFVRGEHELSPRGALGDLARHLHALDVAAIEFRPGLETADVQRLARRLHFARSPELCGGRLARQVEEDTRGSVGLQPISYGALHLAEGARAPGEEPPSGRITWPDLIASLAGGGGPAGESPETLAARFNECATDADEAALEEARARIHEIAAAVESSPPEEQAVLRGRLDSFVGSLTPRLRRSLLRMDPGAPDHSLARMIDLMGVFPTDDVLEALEHVSAGEFRQSEEILRMFGKLHWILEQRAEEHGDEGRVRELFGRIGQGIEWSGATVDPDRVRSSVEELFRIRSVEDVSPDDYREQLESLVQPVVADDFHFGGEQLTAEGIAGLAAELAGHLVRSHEPADHNPGLYRHLASRVDHLVQRERYDLLLSVARAAGDTDAEGLDAETRSAAGAFLDALFAPGRLDDLLAIVASRGDATPPEILELLHVGGVPALRAVLGSQGELPGAAMTALRQVASACDPAEIEGLVGELSTERPGASTRLDLLLDVLPDSRRRQSIGPLLRHPDADTRLLAFSRLSGRSGWSTETLKLALGDGDARIQGLGLDHLGRVPDAAPPQLLTSYIGGALASDLPEPDRYGRAVALLAKRPDGLAGLCETLRFLQITVRPQRARIAARLAGSLASHQDDARVRATLRLWRISPARLLEGLLRKVGRHG